MLKKNHTSSVTQILFTLSVFKCLGYEECKKIFSNIPTLFLHVSILSIFESCFVKEVQEIGNQLFQEWETKIWKDKSAEIIEEMTNWIKNCLSLPPSEKPGR